MDELGRSVAEAIIGIDTLWGGDVMCPSGTGRFIADSWFADEPLPHAYTAPAAARLRETGGVSGPRVDREAVDSYLRQVDIPAAIAGVRKSTRKSGSSPERDEFDLRGSPFACKSCGIWRWRCSARAILCRTSAASRPPRASRRSLRSRKQASTSGRVARQGRLFHRRG